MMSTYLSLHYHVVFSTKNRVPCLDRKWRDQLHSYMGGTIKGLGGFPQNTGGWNDHVHLLFGLKATHVLSDIVRELKKASTVWLRDEVGLRNFHWQEGYAAFTVSHREREMIRSYIDRQEEHHGTRTYKEELLSLLADHGVEYDLKYFV
ncbi:MAG: IS200/IS605 family transposase [Flavobacteriales bacterium]|nr:IS200/IS605 family transposase [Flavobacteriales bacterium]MBK7246240.1 IS200/IS605 family transposase [Flavobacteriales bacterium]MBK7286184.1 IS200/IS605 family transposase [Flavobacteriales bacterium]MBK9059994.1 IS200/IS605 family transposase [Flavobacteriales bacterium]MBK9597274.1 IS200/IS605 family transposase [Flavobacteriales bacterium]